MPNMGGCPDADDVAAVEISGDYDDAKRTDWHRIDLPPFCYYPITVPGDAGSPYFPACPSPDKVQDQSLGEVRLGFLNDPGQAPSAYDGAPPSPLADLVCTRDYGTVLVITSPTPDTCPTVPTQASFDTVGPLLAFDARTPFRWCKYDITYEEDEPACGAGNMPMD
jgi:hypothetical protein